MEGEALDFCRKRFENDRNVCFAVSYAGGIREREGIYHAIYSWDAMVHFTYKSIDLYLEEFYRLLHPGGIAVIHHSNLKNSCHTEIKEDWIQNKSWRSDFSKEEMFTLALQRGFEVLEQKVIDWELKDMDCITVLKKTP